MGKTDNKHLSTIYTNGDKGVSLVAQTVTNLPAMQETWVRTPVWKDPLEKDMATHSSTLAWTIPWTEDPGGLWVHGVVKYQIQLK